MDRVRFGRALGYGARHAAKSLLAAADAAAAPSQQPATESKQSAANTASAGTEVPSRPRGAQPSAVTLPSAGKQLLQSFVEARTMKQQAGKQARRSLFAPFAKFSSVVSLQVTGTFFALLAFVMAQAVWRSRGALHLGWAAAEARRLYLVSGVALLFAYFAISNFLRARRRDRLPLR